MNQEESQVEKASEERFKHRKAALEWLWSNGYKISQGKFYQDCKTRLVTFRDGTVSKWQVAEYARQLDQTATSPEAINLVAKRDMLEIEKLELEVKKRKAELRREDNRWMRTDDAWASIAALLGSLMDNLRHHFHEGQAAVISAAGGDHARGPEVYEVCEGIVGAAFNELAGGRIEGVFAAIGDHDETVEDIDDEE